MRIQEVIEKDLKKAIKEKNNTEKASLKIIVSELQRARTKVLYDDVTVQILQKLKKWELDRLKIISRQDINSSSYLDTIVKYIPAKLDHLQVKQWIEDNIDFSKFKNKLAAIKVVKSHFGPAVDGGEVRKIITDM